MTSGHDPTMGQVGGGALVGTTIAGKYEIVRLLGEGGMGTVYQARQSAMDRMVALKLIRPEMVTTSGAVERFHKEMLVTAKVEHPNTIRVYDFGEADGRLYLAMEFLAGVSLRQLIEGGARLDLHRIVRIAKQVANALGAIHERGLVHRDLKPDNVMLLESFGERDFVKVLDFGIAKSLDDDTRLTTTGRPIGTPAYMSPEQALGRAVDRRTDLYALGVMLYRMASGRIPFDAPTLGSMLLAHATEIPTPVLNLAPETAPALAALIMQLLEKDPSARPASAAEVVHRLDRCLLAPDTVESPVTVSLRGGAKPQAGKRGAIIALAIAGAAVAGTVAYVTVSGGGGGSAMVGSGSGSGSAPIALPVEDVAKRGELDELLAKTEPLAPESCRIRDGATLARLIEAARALAGDQRDKALAILGDNPGAATEGWALLSRAQVATHADRAESSAAEAVRLCPGYAVAHNVSGNALQKRGKVKQAEDAYVRALSAAPMYDAPRFNLGLLQLRQSDATAIATFTELLRRRPDHPNVHLARAQAYVMVEKHEEALTDLEEAVLRQPTSAEAWTALARLRAHLQRGDANAAYCRAGELGDAQAAARCKSTR